LIRKHPGCKAADLPGRKWRWLCGCESTKSVGDGKRGVEESAGQPESVFIGRVLYSRKWLLSASKGGV